MPSSEDPTRANVDPETPPQSADPRRWSALAICLAAVFLGVVDLGIVNVALPDIETDLGASEADLQWIVSGYALAMGLLLIPSGRYGDARGRRRVLLTGVVGFTAASLLAGLAPTPELLSVARVLQGLCTGLVTPQVTGMIQQLFTGAERARAFGLFGAVLGLATATGPLAAGVLLTVGESAGTWRWLFLVNVPIGGTILLLGRRLIPRTFATTADTRLDPVGIALLSTGTLLLMVPLLQDAGADRPWWVAAVGIVVLAVFVAWERGTARRGRQPAVDLGLFRLRSYVSGLTVAMTFFAGYSAVFIVLTLALQLGLGYTPLESGLTQAPFTLGNAAAALLGGRLITRHGRMVVVVGVTCTITGLIATGFLVQGDYGVPVGWILAVPLALAGVGNGLTIAPNQALTLARVPPTGGGSASGVLLTTQRVASALGIAAVSAIFFAAVADHGDYVRALTPSLFLVLGLLALALLTALVDLVAGRRAARSP